MKGFEKAGLPEVNDDMNYTGFLAFNALIPSSLHLDASLLIDQRKKKKGLDLLHSNALTLREYLQPSMLGFLN
jgi:hypothetical protein